MSISEAESNIAVDTWNGKYWGPRGVVALAKARYESSEQTISGRVQWMSVLYSAVGSVPTGAWYGVIHRLGRVVWCLWHLRPQVHYFNSRAAVHDRYQMSPEQKETVASIMYRWSATPRLFSRHRYCKNIFMYASEASASSSSYLHTQLLADLTLARLEIHHGNIQMAREHLNRPERDVEKVTDHNQRARIYRALGELVRQVDDSFTGILASDQYANLATKVPGIGQDVIDKNAA